MEREGGQKVKCPCPQGCAAGAWREDATDRVRVADRVFGASEEKKEYSDSSEFNIESEDGWKSGSSGDGEWTGEESGDSEWWRYSEGVVPSDEESGSEYREYKNVMDT
jgi:hypothetical protein